MAMIAIMLFVGVVTGGINYINQDAMTINKDHSVLSSAYLAIKADIANYSIKQPEPPSELTQVYPNSAYYPSLPANMNITSLTKNSEGEIYVCIKALKTPYSFGTASKLKKTRSTDRMFINNSCGAISDLNYDNLLDNYYLTIFM